MTLPIAAPAFCYTFRRAAVVVEGATVISIVTETTTMLVIGIILSVFSTGFFCWLLFTLASTHSPSGLTAGIATFHSGAGVIGGIIVAFLAGGATLALGQIGFATVRTPLVRACLPDTFDPILVPMARPG